MSYIKRRHFLQAAGSTLAAIGLSQVDFLRQANQYGRVLAQGTPRKLALLVGINAYPLGVPPLRGCVTDVQMQQELLVHRFGFNPSDILTLTDADATRQNLLDAFENHLMQAQQGDVVVFHFSGHGSLVLDPDPILLPSEEGYDRVQGYNGTMVPYDARQNRQGAEVNDIMGKTLFLLMSALQTDQVTVMLDSCHSGGGTRGDLRFRAVESRFSQGEAVPSQEEKDTQTRWLEQLGWSTTELKERRTAGIARGVALGSAQANQLAADATFGRMGAGQFHAGAFTYALTRYLWQQPGSLPVERVFVDLARSTRDVARSARLEQVPVLMVAPGSNHGQQPTYFLAPTTPAAEAVVLGSENGEVRFWLGGISSQSLDAFESGAIFTAIDAQGTVLGQVEQTRREGLMGYGVLQGQPRTDRLTSVLLREQVRGVPQDLTLRLGLDPSLGSDDAAVRASLNQIRRVEPVAVNGEESPNFLIGRMTEEGLALAAAESAQNVGELGSIGLFTPGLVPLRDSFGPVGEPVEVAINRLVPQFQVLLAGRILRSVLNSDTSNLNMTVTVQPIEGEAVDQGGSRGSNGTEMVTQRLDAAVDPLRSGSEITITVTNQEDRSIYVGILGIGSTGRITVLHPTDWGAPEDAALLEPGESLTAPEHRRTRNPGRNYCDDPSEEFHLCLRGAGYVEMLTIASTEPLRDVLRAIQDIADETRATRGQPMSLREADTLNFVESLLGDLDRNTRGDFEVRGGVQAVDVTKTAAISTMIQIVDQSSAVVGV